MLLLVFALLALPAGCSPDGGSGVDPSSSGGLSDPKDSRTVLCLSPSRTVTKEFVEARTGILPEKLLFTSTTSVAVSCLLDGTGDALFTLGPVAEFYAARSDRLSAEVYDAEAEIAMLVSKEDPSLAERLSGVIRKLKEDGTIDDLYAIWVEGYRDSGRPENADEPPEIPLLAVRSDGEFPETVRVGVSGTIPLIDYLIDDGVAGGFTAALWAAIASELEVHVQFVSVLPESKVSALIDGKIDVDFWHFLDAPDTCLATEPYLTVPYGLLYANGTAAK